MAGRRHRSGGEAGGAAPGRRAPVRIAGPLEELLDALNLRDPMAGWKAVELWPEVVGARVAAHARATAFRDGVLYVEVESAAWMNELAYLRRQMASDLNARLGSERVTDIRLLPAKSNTTRPSGEEA